MRASRLLALAAAIAVAGGACGGDGGGGPSNADPVADFTFSCTLLDCTFTNASTDGDGTVTGWSWNFGDNSAAVTTEDAAHSFAAAGTYNVTLTVTDNDGANASVTKQVAVSDVPGNQNPVADFTSACTLLACTFTNASTDADGTIAGYSWNFGDNSALVTTADAAHTFAAAGTYNVTLTVTDDDGASGTVTKQVVVSDVAVNQSPDARFNFICSALECTFTDASVDADGTIASWSWDFDDGSPASTEQNPVHTYAITELTTFSVRLTVTDDDGATDAITKQVAVAPPATLTCNGSACSLTLTQAAAVTVTLQSEDCNAVGNIFIITAPVLDTLFTDGCHSPVPGTPEATFQLDNGNVFAQGTQIEAEVISGSDDPGRIAPALRVTGSFPTWTLEFDDGEDPTGPGEPDFNDLIMTVTATP